MGRPDKTIFLQLWPKCFINFLAVIELIAVLILFITELANVAANFWITNVFAGGWCGLILLIHVVLTFISGCCSPGPAPAFRAAIVAVIGLIATAALISFDAAFISQPSTCILTSSCVDNSVSNATFSYSFQRSFFAVFNSWSPFTYYGQTQVKFLCQTIQLGIGGLSFILCVVYLIIYYACSNKAKQVIEPAPPQQQQEPGHNSPPPQPYSAAPLPPPQPYIMAPQPYGMAPQPYGMVPQPYGMVPQPYSAAPQPYSAGPPPPPQSYSAPPAPAQIGYYGSPVPVQQSVYPTVPPQEYYQPTAPVWRPQPHVPQPPPGAVPWNSNRRN